MRVSPKVTRRQVLRGIGGVTAALPLLESFEKPARAQEANSTFAIFFRQPNGVATQQDTVVGSEPERFWPRQAGALTTENVAGRALDELGVYLNRLLVVKVNGSNYNVGDGHARGAVECLTGTGPVIPDEGTGSLANGESIDHRIGRELNPQGRDSLYLYAGTVPGFLGGPCISYRGPGQRRAAITSPWVAYQHVTGVGDSPVRTKSLNDLVREDLQKLMSSPVLSSGDRRKLELHFTSVRDLEVSLTCAFQEDALRQLETGRGLVDSNNGEDRIRITELHMDVAALAVACGQTRSVAIQFSSGNDGTTRFVDPSSGQRMENFHYISHRISSDGAMGDAIAGSDLQHHYIDRYFAKMFKHLLDRLAAHSMPNGGTLLDAGLAVWCNDLGNGPGHSITDLPWVVAGSAGGRLKQGQYVVPGVGDEPNHPRLLSTLGAAVGCKNASGAPLDDFGDPALPKGQITQVLT